jgi:hypothetical protein
MPQHRTSRVPKVFNSSYQPSKPKQPGKPFPLLHDPAFRPVVWVAVVVLVLVGITRLPVFQIKSVTLEGTDNEQLHQELQTFVGHSIFSRQISQAVERWTSDDRSLAALHCRRGLPNSLSCTAVTRLPALIWVRDGSEYLVDKEGLLYARKGPQPLDLPVLEDRLPGAVELSTNIASGEVVEKIIRLSTLLQSRSIDVGGFFITDSLYQVGVSATAFNTADGTRVEKEFTVLFTSTQPLQAQMRVLAALLDQQRANIAAQVDLRVPGYVYYR